MKRVVLLLVVLLAPGCFLSRTYVNEPIDAAGVQRLQPGVTTAAQVVELLGAPAEVVQLGRRSAYRYEHDQQKTAGVFLLLVAFVNRDSQADRTWVFFDEKDVLTHVGTTLEAKDARYAMPWANLSR